jgi:hypothetical protein
MKRYGSMEDPHGASSRLVIFRRVSWFFPFISSAFALPLTLVLSRLARRRQDLERRGRERYDTLDRLDAELNWDRGKYNTLDALVEALRTPDRWLVYRVEALRDQATEDIPAVERVKAALVDLDEALHKAREDLVSHPIFRRKPNASHMCARITISHI